MLNVRVAKKLLKLNFTNEEDDSSLKMHTAGSPPSGFLFVLQLQLGSRQLTSGNRFFHPLTSSSSFADFNHRDQSQSPTGSNTLSVTSA